MKHFSYALLILFVFTVPAFAGVSISNPWSGDRVSSPFTLSASSSSCSSQSVSSIGYSLDSSSDTTIVHSTSIDTKVSASAGTHTVHVKAWGDKGGLCVTDATFTVTNVTDNVVADSSIVPSNAVSVSNIEALGGLTATHDSGTSGRSSGKMSLVGSPAYSGASRKFVSSYSDSGGERYTISFGDNRTSTNFLYDARVYFTSSSSHIANLEMDLNQTMSNGNTVIFGIQCDGSSGTWDYSENLGSAAHPKGHWAHSHAACNPRKWSVGKWHHVQLLYSRTSTGKITYKAVYLDNVKSTLNVTASNARSLGWGSSLTINFQVDGLGSSGSSTVYLDDLILCRW